MARSPAAALPAPLADVPVRWLLAAATLVAAVATAGSLALSLGLGLVPCRLCWYQRILMYPLVVVFGVALLEGRVRVYRTALPLAAPGLAVAAYHSWLQYRAATRSGPVTCGFGGCSAVQYRVLGLTVPNLAAIAFALLVGVSLLCLLRDVR
ncbi:MAG: disulfide bond formation protein B [Halobacteriaceae archaeon]